MSKKSAKISKKTWKIITISVWIAAISVGGMIYYANHYLPKGTMYDTGDVNCINDGRGPCGESYKEDLRHLDIPEWEKYFKNDALLLLGALVFVGIYMSNDDTKRQ